MSDDTLFVLAENRVLEIVEDERTIKVPGEIRVIEVQQDGTAR
jgi:uncharacterized membrane protein